VLASRLAMREDIALGNAAPTHGGYSALPSAMSSRMASRDASMNGAHGCGAFHLRYDLDADDQAPNLLSYESAHRFFVDVDDEDPSPTHTRARCAFDTCKLKRWSCLWAALEYSESWPTRATPSAGAAAPIRVALHSPVDMLRASVDVPSLVVLDCRSRRTRNKLVRCRSPPLRVSRLLEDRQVTDDLRTLTIHHGQHGAHWKEWGTGMDRRDRARRSS
jgi:hypothetical protein